MLKRTSPPAGAIPCPALATFAIARCSPCAALAQETKEIGHVNTALTNLGLTRSHQIVIERFDDPKVEGVSCYIAQARTGGVSGMVGLAEDPAASPFPAPPPAR